MKVPCQQCGGLVEIAVDGQPQFINTPALSVVVVNHNKPGYCFTCKTSVGLFLRGGNLVFEAAPMQERRPSPILIAPAGAMPKEPR